LTGGFVIEPLGAHDRASFSCGVAVLDRYLREQASQDVKRLMASCFVAVDAATNSLAGYYTLAATSVPATELPPETLKRLPRYPVLPAALIGRLAIDSRFHRRGLGSALLADAALRVFASDTKAFALIVDAIDDNAAGFYRQHGFRPFVQRPMTLFLPLGTARKAATGPESQR
jgi:ribosomal protein S18 acetylase RimI-like enzyme